MVVHRSVTRWLSRLWITALLVTGCSAGAIATPAPQAASDAQVQSLMIGNIKDFDSINAQVHQNAPGQPDVFYRDGVLYVAVLVSKGPAADALCRGIAAITNDPDTAKPLGVRSVVVLAGKDELATCRP